jgi:MFS family permease
MSRAFVADISPTYGRGASYGWFHMATAITALPASVLAGALWTEYGPAAAFAFGGICALLAAVLLLRVATPPAASVPALEVALLPAVALSAGGD